ncbi:hypothetical protein J2848_005270 [Azospirillum lipoferum]|uniref:Helix-turn-helix domain-containing protein n=1 Tax=Azospirillum lipoferum TaxID=193 RepID=A0A5A9GIW2_AZOLI|nr:MULTISPECIES: hypothetical protein [Azospirillum]KAA0593169.1 hypothetical protein FZ942_24845 [Azospirillum lipoferum]MCP1613574.1 hypothetical protein [Azospirillum lipoferum]MDW5532337.1 hypothetical protein [Azospirillum sp. NL1]
MPLDPRSFNNDNFPRWAEEPPTPSEGSLVPGSQFHEEQWIMAAGMLARGNSFLQVSRAMGCSRTTLWRAYYGSQDFRHRVWWERQALNREAELRLSSLRILVAEQIERLVTSGDPATVRWLAERLGLFAGLDLPAGKRQASQPDRQPDDPPAPRPAPKPEDPPAVTVPELDDDDIPGAIRERRMPNPAMVAAVLAEPEAEGPKGVFPYTLNQYEEYPNLNPGPVSRRAAGPFSWRR